MSDDIKNKCDYLKIVFSVLLTALVAGQADTLRRLRTVELNVVRLLTLTKQEYISNDMAKKNEFGIAVSNLTPETARQFNLKDAEGVIVVGVEPDSKGEKAGILPGDIIREINHEEVDDVEDYSEEIGKVKSGETIFMYILRPKKGFIVIKFTK